MACCHVPGLRVSPLITEVYSAFEGRPAAEVAARHDDIYTGVEAPFEQPGDIVRRALAFIRNIRRSYGGKHVVAVTHGDVIAFMLLHASGLPLTPHNKIRLDVCGIRDTYPATGSIATLTYATSSAAELPRISYLNPSAS
jgi:broad specificity phosphatase PhoE